MTDQTKQRTVEMLRELYPEATKDLLEIWAQHGSSKRILAWADQREAAGVAAALKEAAILADQYGPIEHDIGADILAITAPDQSTALATLLSQARAAGFAEGLDAAAQAVETGSSGSTCSYFAARVRALKAPKS